MFRIYSTAFTGSVHKANFLLSAQEVGYIYDVFVYIFEDDLLKLFHKFTIMISGVCEDEDDQDDDDDDDEDDDDNQYQCIGYKDKSFWYKHLSKAYAEIDTKTGLLTHEKYLIPAMNVMKDKFVKYAAEKQVDFVECEFLSSVLKNVNYYPDKTLPQSAKAWRKSFAQIKAGIRADETATYKAMMPKLKIGYDAITDTIHPGVMNSLGPMPRYRNCQPLLREGRTLFQEDIKPRLPNFDYTFELELYLKANAVFPSLLQSIKLSVLDLIEDRAKLTLAVVSLVVVLGAIVFFTRRLNSGNDAKLAGSIDEASSLLRSEAMTPESASADARAAVVSTTPGTSTLPDRTGKKDDEAAGAAVGMAVWLKGLALLLCLA